MIVAATAWTLIAYAQPDKKKQTPQEANDSTPVQADALRLPVVAPKDIALTNKMSWSALFTGWKLSSLNSGDNPNALPACVTQAVDKDQAYVFHIVHWKVGAAGKPPTLVSSSWSAYGSKWHNPDILIRKLAPNGDPLIYGKKRVLLVGVNVFDDAKDGASTLSVRYKSSVTQGTPENTQALGQLATSLLGLTTAGKEAAAVLISFNCQQGTSHLPFDFNAVETIGLPAATDDKTTPKQGQKPLPDTAPGESPSPQPNPPTHSGGSSALPKPKGPLKEKGSALRQEVYLQTSMHKTNALTPTVARQADGQHNANSAQDGPASPSSDSTGDTATNTSKKTGSQNTPQSGQADCSGLSAKNNCTISRTLTSLDKEWWDVSLAVAIPGVKESRYSISGSTLQSKPTTHTDLYALFDLYPSFYWLPKTSGVPHFTLGLPVTGQTFYRPEFGLSENFTSWTSLEKLGFPTRMSFFAGFVYMKTTTVQGAPTTTAQLTADSSTKRVWKPIFGIEVPVSSLISKVGKKSSSTNSSSNKAGSGSTQNSTTAPQ